jgi:two-component system OmpR family response regulator
MGLDRLGPAGSPYRPSPFTISTELRRAWNKRATFKNYFDCMDRILKSDGEINIAVLDIDDAFRGGVFSYLIKSGYNVYEVASSTELDQLLDHKSIHLVILDTISPGEGGLSICRRLVQAGRPAVILVSAVGDEIDRIIGLELGADDCLTKPYNPRELVARIKAILRRRGDDVSPGTSISKGVCKFNGFAFDVAHGELKAPDGSMILLTEREAALLRTFLSNPKTILCRKKLIEQTYGLQSDANDRAIDVQVSRLRRKLDAFCNETLIRTHRGAGYIFIHDISMV